MKKIIYISFPFSSHINPQINLCKAFSDKNVEQIFYTSQSFFSKFDGVNNIELRKYPETFEKKFKKLAEENKDTVIKEFRVFALMYYFYLFADELIQFLIDEIGKEKPSVIICDPFAIWGKMVAKYFNIPLINFYIGILGDALDSKDFKKAMIRSLVLDIPEMIKLVKLKNGIDKKYGNITEHPKQFLLHQGYFSIVPTSREFHPGGENYGDNIKFIGPAHVEDCEIPKNKNKIFIAMGTFSSSDTIWDKCIEATKDLGYEVVVSFGGSSGNSVNISNLPENVKIFDNLALDEYREVLKHSVLFICHGGFNSINDSILYMTPMLVCPNTAEQKSNGILIEELGCGMLYEDKKFEIDNIRKKAIAVINNDNLKIGLEKYRKSFINSMGYKNLVLEINKEFNIF